MILLGSLLSKQALYWINHNKLNIMEPTDDFLSSDSINRGFKKQSLQTTSEDPLTPRPEPVSSGSTKLSFFGKGSTYFGIVALNVVLTVVTLGLYYPWAKAAYRKYLWNETEFKGSRFVFNGTGKEMFKGFAIAYGIFFIFFIVPMYFLSSMAFYILPIFYLLMLFVIPLAIYGGWRYRVSRTSWRGIFFSFDGELGEFIRMFLVHGFLTLITLGIYGPWLRVKIQKYLFSHTKIGNLKLDFHGSGGTLLGINILGAILTVVTVYIYLPIFFKERFNFTINNATIEDGNKRRALVSTLENGEAWLTFVTNGLLLVVTLGLAFPWTIIRTMNMYVNNIEIPSDFDYDNLQQSKSNYRNATGDEMADILDIGLDF